MENVIPDETIYRLISLCRERAEAKKRYNTRQRQQYKELAIKMNSLFLGGNVSNKDIMKYFDFETMFINK